MTGRRLAFLALTVLFFVPGVPSAGAGVAPDAAGRAQEREPVPPAAVAAAIDELGRLDFEVRMNAARTVRRAAQGVAVPALLQAVRGHADGYVRFRALVLLSGFNDPRIREAMTEALGDPNDRLRAVAYAWFEHHPEGTMVPALLGALAREQSEFVRPALIRALAAHGADARVRETLLSEAGRGQDFFRSTVVEALGDYRAEYAVSRLIDVARLEGPLQRHAALALGRIGDRRALETLASLQRTAPRADQPTIAAAICLLGVNCPTHQRYIGDALHFAVEEPGFQDLLRSAAGGLAAIAAAGSPEALGTLLEAGIPSRDPARAAIALAVGTVALRNPPLLLATLETWTDAGRAVDLLREAFDMLDEDFREERFYVTARRTYWRAEEGSRERAVAEALVRQLEF